MNLPSPFRTDATRLSAAITLTSVLLYAFSPLLHAQKGGPNRPTTKAGKAVQKVNSAASRMGAGRNVFKGKSKASTSSSGPPATGGAASASAPPPTSPRGPGPAPGGGGDRARQIQPLPVGPGGAPASGGSNARRNQQLPPRSGGAPAGGGGNNARQIQQLPPAPGGAPAGGGGSNARQIQQLPSAGNAALLPSVPPPSPRRGQSPTQQQLRLNGLNGPATTTTTTTTTTTSPPPPPTQGGAAGAASVQGSPVATPGPAGYAPTSAVLDPSARALPTPNRPTSPPPRGNQ